MSDSVDSCPIGQSFFKPRDWCNPIYFFQPNSIASQQLQNVSKKLRVIFEIPMSMLQYGVNEVCDIHSVEISLFL